MLGESRSPKNRGKKGVLGHNDRHSGFRIFLFRKGPLSRRDWATTLIFADQFSGIGIETLLLQHVSNWACMVEGLLL